jgi:RNA polymerase sigma factor (sigma-70 family)
MDDAMTHPSDPNELAALFSEHRAHLGAVAHRMLGSGAEAEDAVQEAWLRLARSDVDDVANLRGWLTTVVARICLDMLRTRTSRREELGGVLHPEVERVPAGDADPADEAALADSVGVALLVVLDTLEPAERLAFVLHDLFGVPFDEIAPIVGRRPDAARQLASRARRRVRQADHSPAAAARRRREQVVTAFLAASRGGDFAGLLRLLDPEAELRADAVAAAMGADALVAGAEAVAGNLVGRAQAARFTLIDGEAGAAWYLRGEAKVVFRFTVVDERITLIELLGDSDTIAELDLDPISGHDG